MADINTILQPPLLNHKKVFRRVWIEYILQLRTNKPSNTHGLKLLHMIDYTTAVPVAVSKEENTYEVSFLIDHASNPNSLLQVTLSPDHPLYERVHSTISILAMADVGVTIEGVGETFSNGCFTIPMKQEEIEALKK